MMNAWVGSMDLHGSEISRVGWLPVPPRDFATRKEFCSSALRARNGGAGGAPAVREDEEGPVEAAKYVPSELQA